MSEIIEQSSSMERFGIYQVETIISKTNSSCIYKAVSDSGMKVAIKTLNDGIFKNTYDVLQKEAAILEELKECPYIVRFIDFFETENKKTCLVMNFVEGKHPLMGSSGRFKMRVKPDPIMIYVTQIAEALQYAHDKDICHCDVRPENILIRQDTDAVLCDFGLAVKINDNKEYHYDDERDQLGIDLTINKNYLSFQRREYKFIEPSGDQYSLAVVVFQYLCGHLPPKNGSLSIKQQLVNQHYTPDVGAVLEKAMSDDTKKRYESVTEFAHELVTALEPEITKSQGRQFPSIANQVTDRRSSSEPAQLDDSIISTTTETRNQSQGRQFPSIANQVTDRRPSSEPAQLDDSIISTTTETRNQSQGRQSTIRRRTLLAALPAAIALPLTWFKLWSRLSQLFPEQASFGTTIRVYQGHTKPINAVTWSPDNLWIASGSSDNTIQVWKPRSENERIVQQIPDGEVRDVAWSQYPDNSLIAFCSGRNIYIWDFKADELPVKVFPVKGIIRSLHWAPILPARLAVLSDNNILEVLHFDGTQRTQRLDRYTANAMKSTTFLNDVAWSNDSKYLAACSKSTHPYAWVWNAEDGGLLPPIEFPDDIISIAWSTDTKNLLAIGRESSDTHVQVWDVLNGGNRPTEYRYRGASTGKDRLAWSPGALSSTMGMYIAAGAEGDGYVYVWNILTSSYESFDKHRQSSTIFQDFTNQNIDITTLAWSPDGTMIASAGTDSLVRVWSSGIGTF